MPEYKFKNITIPLPLSIQHIYYAVVGAFEGGSNYWLQQADYVGPKTPDAKRKLVWWGHEELYDSTFKMLVTFDDPKKEEGNGKGKKTITWSCMVAALQVMAEKDPRHFGDLISDSGADATTYDVFMQYVVLGEVVYG